MAPILFPANQPPSRPYRGGQQIASFRGTRASSDHEGEDWIASTTCCGGCEQSKLGVSITPDGRLFADVVAEQPEYWLGKEHLEAWGVDTKLLVKFCDAGQRLFVHAHPHRDWARQHLGTRHGKTEAWHILTPGEVHLGLKEDISHDELLKVVDSGNGSSLLERMHRLDVESGQTLYVPAGTLHSIGEGVLFAEVQEPEDLSILCEWHGFEVDGMKDGHLGLGYPTALTAINRQGCSRDEIMKLSTPSTTQGSVLVDEAKTYFGMEKVIVDGTEKCPRGFAILIVRDGSVKLTTNDTSMDLVKGNTLAIPHSDGDFSIEGHGQVLVVRPPRGA